MWDREMKEAGVGVLASDAVWAWSHGEFLDPVALTRGAVSSGNGAAGICICDAISPPLGV